MATYKVTIDEREIAGQRFLALMKTLPFISFDKSKIKRCGLDEALEDIKMGRVSKAMTFEEFKAYTQKIWNEA